MTAIKNNSERDTTSGCFMWEKINQKTNKQNSVIYYHVCVKGGYVTKNKNKYLFSFNKGEFHHKNCWFYSLYFQILSKNLTSHKRDLKPASTEAVGTSLKFQFSNRWQLVSLNHLWAPFFILVLRCSVSSDLKVRWHLNFKSKQNFNPSV